MIQNFVSEEDKAKYMSIIDTAQWLATLGRFDITIVILPLLLLLLLVLRVQQVPQLPWGFNLLLMVNGDM